MLGLDWGSKPKCTVSPVDDLHQVVLIILNDSVSSGTDHVRAQMGIRELKWASW